MAGAFAFAFKLIFVRIYFIAFHVHLLAAGSVSLLFLHLLPRSIISTTFIASISHVTVICYSCQVSFMPSVFCGERNLQYLILFTSSLPVSPIPPSGEIALYLLAAEHHHSLFVPSPKLLLTPACTSPYQTNIPRSPCTIASHIYFPLQIPKYKLRTTPFTMSNSELLGLPALLPNPPTIRVAGGAFKGPLTTYAPFIADLYIRTSTHHANGKQYLQPLLRIRS